MHVRFDMTDDILIAGLEGELDHHSAAEVRKEIDKTIHAFRCRQMVFNFRQVSFMDSSGIGVVMGRYNKLKELGGGVCVCECSGYIDRILSMAGIYTIAPKYDTVQKAIGALKEKAEGQAGMKEVQ